ncbi:MAG: Heat shock protein 70 [Ilumatobacteraceae bacterium]|nr:Heat shock protein 70 [Ilumatobacteraceae bacterium]
MEYGLGIDFGTTYCAAAISTERNVEICTLGTRAPSIPTAVLIRADGEVLVGEAAERRAVDEPDRAAFAFKRRLGDPTPLVLGGTPYGAETLTSYVLTSIVRQVTQQNGGPPAKIVLSHPAPYGDYKLDLLRLAARQADIGPVSFISEPEAAAVHYSTLERIDIGQVVAVYDFGGGTFDAALLRRTADGFTLIGQPEGLERIGGIDLDHAVLQHVLGSIGRQPADLIGDSPDHLSAMARLRDDCRSAKEALSSDADVTIPVTLPNLMTHVRLTRAEFEAMIRPRIADTIEALRRAVRSTGLAMEEVDRILLVGGTSRIPLVREMVATATGRPVTIDVHPKHSVAMGAAALARPGGAPAASIVPPPTVTGLAPPSRPAPATVEPTSPVAAPAPAPPPPPPSTPVASPTGPAAAEPSHDSKRKVLLAIGALALVAIIAVVAIVVSRGGDPKQSADTTTPSAAGPAETTASADTQTVDTTTPTGETQAVATVTEPFAGLLPRTTKYASLGISINHVIVRTQDPTSFLAGAEAQPGGPLWAYIDGSATNPLVRIPIAISATSFTLALMDGSELVGQQFNTDTVVPPGGSTAFNVAFDLGGATDLSNAVVKIGDPGDEPSTVALDGDPVEPDQDRDVLFAPALITVTDPAGNTVDWNLGQTSSGLDSYYDGADQSGGQTTADRRAGAGLRWINMSLTLTAGVCSCDGLDADTSMIMLVVDGTPIAPTNSFSDHLPPSTSKEEGVLFEYPATATTATLLIGPAGSPDLQQSVEVTLT